MSWTKLYYVNWISAVLGFCSTLYAGLNAGRLSVPDTMAGPRDYALYVAAPVLLSLTLALLRFTARSAVATQVNGNSGIDAKRPLVAIGLESSDLIASGQFDKAQKCLDAARTITGYTRTAKA